MQTTPLYYSEISGITGVSFAIGHTTLFAPCESDSLHVVPDGVAMIVTSRVPDLFSRFLRETVIEKRLQAIRGGGR